MINEMAPAIFHTSGCVRNLWLSNTQFFSAVSAFTCKCFVLLTYPNTYTNTYTNTYILARHNTYTQYINPGEAQYNTSISVYMYCCITLTLVPLWDPAFWQGPTVVHNTNTYTNTFENSYNNTYTQYMIL